MKQIDIDDGNIQKVAAILKGRPQNDHKLFPSGKDIVHTALESVMNENHYEEKLNDQSEEIDALRARIANFKMLFQTYGKDKSGDRFLISDRVSQTDLWRRRLEQPTERHSNLILFPPPLPL